MMNVRIAKHVSRFTGQWVQNIDPKGPCTQVVDTLAPKYLNIGTTLRPKYILVGHMDP